MVQSPLYAIVIFHFTSLLLLLLLPLEVLLDAQVIFCFLEYTSPSWLIQQKVLLNLLAWLNVYTIQHETVAIGILSQSISSSLSFSLKRLSKEGRGLPLSETFGLWPEPLCWCLLFLLLSCLSVILVISKSKFSLNLSRTLPMISFGSQLDNSTWARVAWPPRTAKQWEFSLKMPRSTQQTGQHRLETEMKVHFDRYTHIR